MSLATIVEGRILTKAAGEALEPYRLVKLSSNTLVYADYGDGAIGVTPSRYASGVNAGAALRSAEGTVLVEVAGAIEAGDYLWPTTDGKAIPVGPGEPSLLSLDDGSASGAIVEAMWVPGFLEDMHIFKEDFHTLSFSETADLETWLKTSTDTAAGAGDVCAIADDEVGGVLTLTTTDNGADSECMQVNGESFLIATGKPLWLTGKFKLADVDKCDIVFGLSVADVDIEAGATDTLLFRTDSEDGNLDYVLEKDSTETAADTAVNLVDDTFNEVGLYINSGKDAYIYVDGVEIAKVDANANLPDNEALSPAFEVHNDANAQANTIEVDYFDVYQVR